MPGGAFSVEPERLAERVRAGGDEAVAMGHGDGIVAPTAIAHRQAVPPDNAQQDDARRLADCDRGWRHPHFGIATLAELFAPSPRDGGWAGFVRALLPPGKPLLWVQERMAIVEGGRIHPPGLGQAELIHVETRDARDALWAMEEGLRCPALGAVIGEYWGDPAALDFTATRRLAVAAERHGVAAWLIRLGGTANLSGARWRWRVASAPGRPGALNPRAPGEPAWAVELFRARMTPPGALPGSSPASWPASWILTHEPGQAPGAAAIAGRFDLVAVPRDRAVDEGDVVRQRAAGGNAVRRDV